MLVILVPDYKTHERPYVNGFVHSRILSYISHGIETEVFVINSKRKKERYEIEGVCVNIGNADDLMDFVYTNNVSTVCAHFINEQMITFFEKIDVQLKILIFVHGNEALHWYQRIFPGVLSSLRQSLAFCKYSLKNIYEIRKIRKFLKNTQHKCIFVTVSKWMQIAAENTWKCKGKYQWNIIPNIVDERRFPYCEKTKNKRLNLLSIRPFSSGKYANDITSELIQRLSHEPEFADMKFVWYGSGRLFDKTVKYVKNHSNVTLNNFMVKQTDISRIHQDGGIFICPTRQDAQGVSMCEAMSSGLVPITLCNTAIPEFLPDDFRLKCYTIDDMKQLVLRLVRDADLFLEMSAKCSSFVREKCGVENTICREIKLIQEE